MPYAPCRRNDKYAIPALPSMSRLPRKNGAPGKYTGLPGRMLQAKRLVIIGGPTIDVGAPQAFEALGP